MAKTMKWFLMLFLAVAVTGAVAVAQHNHADTMNQPQTSSNMDQSQNDSGSGNMMMSLMQKLDKLEQTIAAGRASNDPAKMKAALNDAQAQLADAKQYVNKCPMMSGGHMQSGDMDHMNGMSNQSSESQNQSSTPQ